MIDMVIFLLQSCINLMEVVPDSYSETCHDGNQLIDIKVEVPEEEDPLLITCPIIETELEVSFWLIIRPI
jgi:hypothetical protein